MATMYFKFGQSPGISSICCNIMSLIMCSLIIWILGNLSSTLPAWIYTMLLIIYMIVYFGLVVSQSNLTQYGDGAFLNNKTFIIATSNRTNLILTVDRANDDFIRVETCLTDSIPFTHSDNMLVSTPIEIRVYN